MTKSSSSNLIIVAGAFNAFIAVVAGAFAAHGLKNSLSPEYLNTFNTAAEYQLTHGIGLIIIAILNTIFPSKYNVPAATIMFIGIILFSGSLYLLTLTDTRWLGMITPIGGSLFLIAWLIVGLTYWFHKDRS